MEGHDSEDSCLVDNLAKFPVVATENIQGLNQVVTMCVPYAKHLGDKTTKEQEIMRKLADAYPSVFHEVSYEKSSRRLTFVTKIKSEFEQLHQDPEAKFKAFLGRMQKCYGQAFKS